MTALPTALLEHWHHRTDGTARTLVLPDGCRDLICIHRLGEAPQWLVSPLADTAYGVDCGAGTRFWGYRLQPGALVNEAALLAAMGNCPTPEAADVLGQLDTFTHQDPRVTEALHGLAGTDRVAAAVRQLGVTERSLERLLASATGRTPGYWLALARVRRAARALAQPTPLAAVAADMGYADQAHMGREFRRWFGVSPGRLRTLPELLAVAMASGHGTA